MRLPWNRPRRRRKGLLVAAIALGTVVLTLPFLPSVRRYVRIESM